LLGYIGITYGLLLGFGFLALVDYTHISMKINESELIFHMACHGHAWACSSGQVKGGLSARQTGAVIAIPQH